MVRVILFAVLTLVLTVAGQAQGVFRWQQPYGSAANEAGGRAVAVAGGGYLLMGTQERLGGLAADIYLVRVDATGSVLWQRTTPLAQVYKVSLGTVFPTLDGAGNLVVIGSGRNVNVTAFPAFVTKLTPVGDTVWVRRFVPPNVNSISFFSKPLIAADGNYVVLANLNANAANNNSNYHLLKFDAATGATLWDRPLQSILSSALPAFGYANAVERVGNGFLLFISGNTGTRGAIGTVVLDANGLELRRQVGGRPPFYPPSITLPDRNGGVVAASAQQLTKLTAQGDTVWHTVAPQAYQYRTWDAKGLVQEASGGYAVLGESRYQQPGGGANTSALHLVRFSATGQLLADSLLYRPQDTFGGSLLLSATGEYVFSGYTSSGPLGGSDLLMAQVRRVGPLAVRGRSLLAAEPLGVHPNPATGTEAGRLPRPAGLVGTATVRVLDAVGREAWRGPLPGGAAEVELPTAQLRPGLYVVQLTAPDGRRWAGRWLRQ